MIINEIFYSIQGEGFLAGVPSVFIRIAGCPLRCRWCDTKYAWSADAGTEYSIGELTRKISELPGGHVVITGGEPMIHSDLPELVISIKKLGRHVTIETSGIAYVPGLTCDLMSISPKFPDSQSRVSGPAADAEGVASLNIGALNSLVASYPYQLKFVIADEYDITQVLQLVGKLNNVDSSRVMLMPNAASRKELLERSPLVARLCLQYGFAFCQRLHVFLWDKQKGV